MNFEEKKCWVAFNVFNGIGPLRFKLLLNYFGTAKSAFGAAKEELLRLGLNENLVNRFDEFRRRFNFDDYFRKLEKLDIKVLCAFEEQYPFLLKEIQDYPPVIYIKQRSQLRHTGTIFEKKTVAVVGTRKVTGYGRQVTEMISEGLVVNGVVVVSGLARGVDKIAHETAVLNNGQTIAVLGSGLDLIYPPEHTDLAEKIVDSGGAIISEFPLGMVAMPGNFPARNRIISGLSLGVVVTEAADDSGSLITASCAAEQGREVFAIPGPITSPLSRGTSELIKKGAKVVTKVEDIFEELKIENCKLKIKSLNQQIEDLNQEEKAVVKLLEIESLHIDEIGRKMNIDSGKVGGILSLLEIKGIIKSFGGGIYGLG